MSALTAEAQTKAPISEWVHPGPDGKLFYKADAKGNRIPDFSNVGYRGGVVPIPDVPVRATVEPGTGDATVRVQAAIDDVSKMAADAAGRRGAVLLKKGRYPFAGTLRLHTGGVVLRGEGQGDDGTLLVVTGTIKRSLIVVENRGARPQSDEDDASAELPPTKRLRGGTRALTDNYVPVGAHAFHVDHADGLRVGAEIVIRRPSTAAWVHHIGMDQISSASHPVVQWKPGSNDLVFNRTITAVSGSEVTVDAPLMAAFERHYGGGEIIWRSATTRCAK